MSAGTAHTEQGATEVSFDPRTGAATHGPERTRPEAVLLAVEAAAAVASSVAGTPPAERQRWLESVADRLQASAEELVALADAETALGMTRLRGELSRAAAQARFYGAVAAEGSWLEIRLDDILSPAPVDLRRMNVPLGPVAVFGASNFPFMFGVAGHDTASALAAGCPVLVKAHPAHPRLSVRLAEIVQAALVDAAAPRGAFGLVVGFEAGLALVGAPQIAAVAFTGSQAGGMAILDHANRRERPIPVFAEMGTVNPAVLTPAGAASSLQRVAQGFVESFTLGQGQFCTKPGLLLAPGGVNAVASVAGELSSVGSGWLLTEGIATAYRKGLEQLSAAGARQIGQGGASDTGYAATPTIFAADLADLVPGSPLLEECFGPVAVVAEYESRSDLSDALARLQPSLAATIASGGPEDPDLPWLVSQLTHQVGRIVVDGWPTGVATAWSQQHGGPWPATSRPDASSVGAAALDRFTRAVAFQDVPDAVLPQPLRNGNPWSVPRRVNGVSEHLKGGS